METHRQKEKMKKINRKLDQIIRIYTQWRQVPETERELRTQEDFARFHKVHVRTLARWNRELEAVESKEEKDRVIAFRDKLYMDAMRPKAPSKTMELYARMEGLLTDKSEVKVKLEYDADEIARRNLEAERQLRESGYGVWKGGYGVAEVPTERPLLLKDLRKGERPTEGDDTIRDVGTSGESS